MVLSDHLQKSSNAEALKTHKFRMGSMPKQFNSVLIGKKLNQVNLSKTSPNKMVSSMLKKTDLLSVILHDGNKVKINQFSKKIGERDRIYSMSIAKSFIGILVGHAKCDGLISDLGNSAGQYLSETKGTIYEKQSIRNLINMTAGDSRSFNLWSI